MHFNVVQQANVDFGVANAYIGAVSMQICVQVPGSGGGLLRRCTGAAQQHRQVLPSNMDVEPKGSHFIILSQRRC